MAIILPCAGRSSRYPNMRPKYLLTLYDGELIIEKVAKKYFGKDELHFILLKEHIEKYDARIAIERIFGNDVYIHELDKVTSGPAETIYTLAKNLNEPIFISDCDSIFDTKMRKDDHVCVADLRKNLQTSNVASKSFVQLNEQNMVTNIVEKNVISNYFCVGGYGFSSSKEYCEAFLELPKDSEVFISHVIKKILSSHTYDVEEVQNYLDLGTFKEFHDYNSSRPCFFVDIDGTIVKNQSRYFSNNYSTKYEAIQNSVSFFQKKKEEGCKIIFTTSRPESSRAVTISMLNDLGFSDCDLIMNLPHSPRIVVNDYNETNPFPTAIAMNVPRNDNAFWEKQK